MKVVTEPVGIDIAGLWTGAQGGRPMNADASGLLGLFKGARAVRGVVFGASLCLSAGLIGCGSGVSSPVLPAAVAEHSDVPDALPPALDEIDVDGLRARAAQALREQRIHTPAGDSAVDYYLALRDKEPGQIDVISALSELQPYVVIAGEQALLDDDLAESGRLQGLLARMDSQAPALPRLREGLRTAEAARAHKTREETQRLIGERADAGAQLASAQRDRGVAVGVASYMELKAAAAASAVAADEAAAQASTPAASVAVATSALAPAIATAERTQPVTMPRLIADASPRYPLPALNRRIEGSVEIGFNIFPDGRTGAAKVLSAQPAGVFEDAALAAVTRLRFEASGETHTARRILNFKLPSR